MKADELAGTIRVAVTCDTEFLPPWTQGSWADMATWSFEQGVPLFTRILENRGIKGTYFTQATAIERFGQTIQGLDAAGHLVGSHGYNHENYGETPVKVWTPGQPELLGATETIRRQLERCIAIHRQVLGKHPRVFVAPFDNTGARLTGLLDELGFEVDCSLHNYSLNRNSFPFLPLADRRIVEIPLTVVDLGAGIARKNVLEAFTFDRRAACQALDRYIDDALIRYPFCMILLTCHPYEFLTVDIPHPREVLIVGPEKAVALEALLDWLAQRGARFVDPLQVVAEVGQCGIELERHHVF